MPSKLSSVRPVREAVAVLFFAIAGWYLLEPQIARLFPSRLATSDRSAHVVIGEALVDVGPSSILDVHRNGRSAGVSLSYGEASFDVLPSERPWLAPFEVDSGDLAVAATDARFSVSARHDHSRVHVDRGIVEIAVGGARFRLSAGDRWPAASE